MNYKRNLLIISLMFFGSHTLIYSQKKPPKNKSIKHNLHDIALQHKQIYDNSCIPMSVEMVLKYNHKVPINYYGLQNKWQNKMDGTFNDFDGKIIGGLKFKRQFNIQRGNNFPLNQLYKTIDAELAAGRKVIISLPEGANIWHMYIIDRKIDHGDYLAYSRYNNPDMLVTKEYVKRWVIGCKGTDILTYTVDNRN